MRAWWTLSLLSMVVSLGLVGCSGGGTDGTAPLGARSAELTTTLLSADGSPIAIADLSFQDSAGIQASAITNQDGQAKVALLEGASYSVVVNLDAASYTTNSFELKLGLLSAEARIVVDTEAGTAELSIINEVPRFAEIENSDPALSSETGAAPAASVKKPKKPTLNTQNTVVAGGPGSEPPPPPSVVGVSTQDKYSPPKGDAIPVGDSSSSQENATASADSGSQNEAASPVSPAIQGGGSSAPTITIQSPGDVGIAGTSGVSGGASSGLASSGSGPSSGSSKR